MSRRNAAPKREILPDPVYGSQVVAKFINCLMKSGKKSIAEKIVYTSLDSALEKLKKVDLKDDEAGDGSSGSRGSAKMATPVHVLEYVLRAVRPLVEVKSRRVGGSTYQVPIEVSENRGMALAMKWLIDFSRARSEKTMINQLTAEIVDACQGRGASIKKRIDTHKMAEANKAFAHFRW
ncbi:MAG: 30S ribosomal protein S7 [Gammaproteobacteria bacterium]|nr:30S ribosomal protein S7 [Gammaproteobacteria bacterium]MCD8542538.1 30S ribosomal protein S7 [Gammaproteobacteria bacterium]